MNNPKFHKGEVLDVTFKNVTITDEMPNYDGSTEFFTIAPASSHVGGPPVKLAITPGTEGVTIIRKVPADGSPEVGDVWQDRYGAQWFAAAHYIDVDASYEERARANADGWYLVLVPIQLGEQGSPVRPEEVIDRCGPIQRLFRPTKTMFAADADDAAPADEPVVFLDARGAVLDIGDSVRSARTDFDGPTDLVNTTGRIVKFGRVKVQVEFDHLSGRAWFITPATLKKV